ncbi:ORF45 [Fowl aviadenovirus C]|nr:ORF45 [Fowl aviadenovirus C]
MEDFVSIVFCLVRILEARIWRGLVWLLSVCFLGNIHMTVRSGLRVYAFCVTRDTRKSTAWVNIA